MRLKKFIHPKEAVTVTDSKHYRGLSTALPLSKAPAAYCTSKQKPIDKADVQLSALFFHSSDVYQPPKIELSEQHNKFCCSIWTAEFNRCVLAMQQIVLAPAEKRLSVGSSSREGPFPPLHSSHTEQVPPKYQQRTLLLSQLRHYFPCHLLKESFLYCWTGRHYSIPWNLNRNNFRRLVDCISFKGMMGQ